MALAYEKNYSRNVFTCIALFLALNLNSLVSLFAHFLTETYLLSHESCPGLFRTLSSMELALEHREGMHDPPNRG